MTVCQKQIPFLTAPRLRGATWRLGLDNEGELALADERDLKLTIVRFLDGACNVEGKMMFFPSDSNCK